MRIDKSCLILKVVLFSNRTVIPSNCIGLYERHHSHCLHQYFQIVPSYFKSNWCYKYDTTSTSKQVVVVQCTHLKFLYPLRDLAPDPGVLIPHFSKISGYLLLFFLASQGTEEQATHQTTAHYREGKMGNMIRIMRIIVYIY